MSVVVGGNFADGKGNATGYLSYIDAQPTRLSERDFSACQLSGQGSTSAAVRSTRTTSSRWPTAEHSLFWATTWCPFGTPGTSPPALFNSNPYMNLKHGRERYQGGVFAKYEWSEKATLYTDFMFMKDQAETAVAPSGLFIGDVAPRILQQLAAECAAGQLRSAATRA